MSTIEIPGKLITSATLYTEGAELPPADGEDDGAIVTEPFALQLITYDGDAFIMSGTREEISSVLDAARALLDMIPAEPTTKHLCDDECGEPTHPRDGRVVPA